MRWYLIPDKARWTDKNSCMVHSSLLWAMLESVFLHSSLTCQLHNLDSPPGAEGFYSPPFPQYLYLSLSLPHAVLWVTATPCQMISRHSLGCTMPLCIGIQKVLQQWGSGLASLCPHMLLSMAVDH